MFERGVVTVSECRPDLFESRAHSLGRATKSASIIARFFRSESERANSKMFEH